VVGPYLRSERGFGLRAETTASVPDKVANCFSANKGGGKKETDGKMYLEGMEWRNKPVKERAKG